MDENNKNNTVDTPQAENQPQEKAEFSELLKTAPGRLKAGYIITIIGTVLAAVWITISFSNGYDDRWFASAVGCLELYLLVLNIYKIKKNDNTK